MPPAPIAYRRFIPALALLLFATAPPLTRAATIVSVGAGDRSCQYASLQEALDAAPDGADIHVRTDYSGTPITITRNGDLSITGGYARCGDAAPTTDATFVQGFTTPGKPVMAIQRDTGRLVLSHLQIAGATNDSGVGGGIAFTGGGTLALDHVSVASNVASRGGGLYVLGSGAVVMLGAQTSINGNIAHLGGGGIYLEGRASLVAIEDDVSISSNGTDLDGQARGGGITVDGPEATVDMASTSEGGPTVGSNYAVYGGGIAIGHGARVRLFSSHAGRRTRVDLNNATRSGGGIYIAPAEGRGTLCGFVYSLSGNGANDDGGNLFVGEGGQALMTLADRDAGAECGSPDITLEHAAPCPASGACNLMDLGFGTAGSLTGSAVSLDRATLRAEAIQLRDTLYEASVLDVRGTTASAELADCLIADSRALMRSVVNASAGARVSLDGCTIANNATRIFAAPPLAAVLTSADDVAWTVHRSILWQQDSATVVPPIGSVALVDVIASDAATLATLPLAAFEHVSGDDPRFLDTTQTLFIKPNYRLSGDSPAVDYTADAPAIASDLEGHPRGHDLLGDGHPFDIGAYERQGFVAPVTFPPTEAFDELDNPEQPPRTLPAGWTTTHTGEGQGWITTEMLSATQPPLEGQLAAFARDEFSVSDSAMDSPTFHVVHDGRVSFRQNVSLEESPIAGFAFDGAVLEIRIGSDPVFRDILDAGGRFVTGRYDHLLFDTAATGCPLGGRAAWSGDSRGYVDVVVDLPASADNEDVTLRWRVGTDSSGGEFSLVTDGYWVDDLRVDPEGSPDDSIFFSGFDLP